MPVIDTFPPPDQTVDGEVVWTEEELAEIETIFAKYPTKRSAILPLLWKAQHKWKWLSYDVLRLVGQSCELPNSEVLAVASFYSMLKKRPHGKYTLQVCHTLSCALMGADALIAQIEETLGIKPGETTEDGMFTLERVECLASCGSAPMMQIDEHFYEFLDQKKVGEILDGLRKGAPLPTPRPEVDQWHWNVQS